jgi:Cupredoxin-like domain
MRHPDMTGRLLALLGVWVLSLAPTGAALALVAHRTTAARATVTFSDASFGVSPSALEAGATTFVVVNRGKKRHAFEITGPGLKAAHTPALAAGKSATLTVTLRPGAYMLSDPVGLSAYNVQYIDVTPAAVLSATGDSSVIAPPVALPPMCGSTAGTP